MLRKIHGSNVFHIKFLGPTNIKCENGPVLPPAQVFYFNGQSLHTFFCKYIHNIETRRSRHRNVCTVLESNPRPHVQ
jgi:hypothetical protein